MFVYLIIIIFPILTSIYYFYSFGYVENYEVLLTVSTFLFSIFTGFFIARQGARYSRIRDEITSFDGNMSNLYRQSMHFGKDFQRKFKDIIETYYNRILNNNSWDYNFTHKTTTITDLHVTLDTISLSKDFSAVKTMTIQSILTSLREMQKTRKSMIALHNERIPQFQWVLLYFIAGVLFLTLSIIPAEGILYSAILKGVFASSIIFVFILISRFDKLEFFEGAIGENSAQDVIDIFVGKK